MEAPKQSFHVRSVSIPITSHPTVLEVEENLKKLRAFLESSSASAMTADIICNGLAQVSELYHGINNILQLPSVQHALSNLEELESIVDGSVRMLDVCGAIKDEAVTLREHLQGLQLVLRRSSDSVARDKVHAYIRARKETQKIIKKSYKEVKKISQSVSEIHENSEVFMKVLGEAREITASLLCSIISFMSGSTTPKGNKWSLISKAIQKKRVACEADLSGMHCLDIILCGSLKDAGNMLVAPNQLEAAEMSLGGLENGLECLFRSLIQNRVSLLNVLSL